MLNYAAGNPVTGYNLTRSLRFRASASASLSRTPASAGNRTTFTYSDWVKRGKLSTGVSQALMYAYASTNDVASIVFDGTNDQLSILAFNGGSIAGQLVTNRVFRDPSAWYHIVIAVDTTQATAANRIKMYVNGVQETSFSTTNYPAQNTQFLFNSTAIHRIAAGDYPANPFNFDGYLAEVNFIDGQALTPSSFGSTNSTTGVWQPARYTGTYGTNGFYLPFTDNSALTTSSNVGLGKDFSGNGNYWTTNNISITAGVTYDSMTDVPTLTSATAANFAVLNPLNPARSTLTNGNLTASGSTDTPTIIPTSGTYYFEIGGVSKTWIPPAAFPAAAGNYNFGQRPFTNTPTGTLLNTFNLPDSTIKQGNKVMDATLYTGNLTGQTITNTAGFKPDLVWAKSRSAATDNKLVDSVRGATLALVSNSTAAETTDLTGIVSFNSNGFTLGTSTTYNNLAATYVGWQWQAGQGSSSSNTSGTITSTVSVNASAGFSVVTWTGTGANATVGHGLGVAPSMFVIKARGQAGSWGVYHSGLPTPSTGLLILDSTAAVSNSATYWNSTVPSSTVFSLGAAWASTTFVAYCWSEIAGFSKFGSYSGNGSADGPFVYLGFRPKYVMIKCSGAAASWVIEDSSRDVYNPETNGLFAENAAAEVSGYLVDFLSNGFKIRNTTGGNNSSGLSYVFAAFAENPFKNSLAR